LLIAVVLLVAGEPAVMARWLVAWLMMLDWRRFSIWLRRSRISLSPASSLIPGSR
jgi:hypothetical protein